MRSNKFFILFIVLFITQGCDGTSSDTEIIDTLIDVDPNPNQINEATISNGDNVGLTVYADSLDEVTYQLLDPAGGRFIIDESEGIVYLADHLLLNANLFPKHAITVQVTYADGSSQRKVFDISVIPATTATNITVPLTNESKPIVLANDIKKKELTTKSTNSYNHSVYKNSETVSKYSVLLDWNDGHEQSLKGWRWSNNVAYGNPGWILSKEGPLGSGEKYAWGRGARSFNKGDYGKKNTALIDTHNYAPSTSGGGSLQVTETEGSTDHRSTWWLWYDGKPLSERGITNAKTDRMDFYLKTEGMNGIKDDGGKESIGDNFHIGTYLCWKKDKPAYGTGDGCPYEGPGNQHYYHYLGINPDAWIHVLLDQHPQHKRGNKKTLKNNPVWDKNKKNYFEQLSQFYVEIRAKQKQKTNFRIDEILFYSTEDSVEPMQNEQSISSLWVGYWPEKDVWEMGFHDKSHRSYNDKNNSTFEIRWSVTPITNQNFYKANPIEPMFYGGVNTAGLGGKNLIRRANGWRSNLWTRFELPNDIEDNNLKVFFAIKDVSKKGEHKGLRWPYKFGDGHDAPSNNIKIIDYSLRPSLN